MLESIFILQVALGDLIISEEASFGNVTFSVSEDILSIIRSVQKSAINSEALWKLPGLLPRAPSRTASQVLLWISQLVMEVNSVCLIIFILFKF